MSHYALLVIKSNSNLVKKMNAPTFAIQIAIFVAGGLALLNSRFEAFFVVVL